MKKLCCGFIFCLFIFGCGGKAAPPAGEAQGASSPEQMAWGFAAKAITLNIRATVDLNFQNEQAHTVLLRLYQLSDLTAFKQLADKSDGLIKLLQGDFADPSVKYVDKLVVAPGELTTQIYDRVEGVKFVALVAGFNKLDPAAATHAWSVPVLTRTEGLILRDTYYYPGPLEADIVLTADSIQKTGAN
jgi:type VI secretion system VasD/TssJ family lipoprotein